MKDNARSKLALATLLVATAIASTASADECRLYKDNGRTGTNYGFGLLNDVTHTFATGSPNDSTWANTSVRYLQSTLTSNGVNNNVSSIQIIATQSDVSLYLFDGDNFTGRTTVFFCKKGNTCWLDPIGGHIDNRTSSAICQREFFRKAGKKPGDDLAKQLIRANNPFIPFASISTAVTNAVHAAASQSDDLDAVRHTNSEDDVTLFTRTLWMPKHAYCAAFGTTCNTFQDKYVDYMRISKKFEVDLGSGWLDVAFFVDDDYAHQVDWYVRPVLDGSGNTLKFWWARTTHWTESGSFHDDVLSALSSEINKVNIQTSLRDGVVNAAIAAGCLDLDDEDFNCEPKQSCWCVDGKERLQMSFFNDDADIGPVRFDKHINIETEHPIMVLNADRNSQ